MTKGLDVGVRPLFSGRTLIAVALLAEVALVMCFLTVTAGRDWSFSVFASLFGTTFLAVLVFGDIVRCRFRMSLRTLLGLVTLAAVCCAMFGIRIHNAAQQKRMVAAVVDADGKVGYDFPMERDWLETMDGWMFPGWAVKLFGHDMFGEVTYVSFYRGLDDEQIEEFDIKLLRRVPRLVIDRCNLTDVGVAHLAPLTQLNELNLRETAITDEGLIHLSGMRDLEVLELDATSITDAGLKHLYKHSRLRFLSLDRTAVTLQGVEELRKRLPECEVYHR